MISQQGVAAGVSSAEDQLKDRKSGEEWGPHRPGSPPTQDAAPAAAARDDPDVHSPTALRISGLCPRVSL